MKGEVCGFGLSYMIEMLLKRRVKDLSGMPLFIELLLGKFSRRIDRP